MHLLRSKLKITDSDAQRPVLLKIALNALKKRNKEDYIYYHYSANFLA